MSGGKGAGEIETHTLQIKSSIMRGSPGCRLDGAHLCCQTHSRQDLCATLRRKRAVGVGPLRFTWNTKWVHHLSEIHPIRLGPPALHSRPGKRGLSFTFSLLLTPSLFPSRWNGEGWLVGRSGRCQPISTLRRL